MILSLFLALACGVNAESQWQTQSIDGITYVSASGANSRAIDFAELERKFPIEKQALENLRIDDLRKLSQEQLAQLYARLKTVEMPSGAYRGQVLQISALPQVGSLQARFIRLTANSLWSGKIFEQSGLDQVARSLVPATLTQKALMKAAALSALGRVADFSSAKQYVLANKNYLGILPSKVFLGQSLVDSRRESIVLDFAVADRLDGFNGSFDSVSLPTALEMRDELREIRPGVYLGRAYIHQIFALSFLLER